MQDIKNPLHEAVQTLETATQKTASAREAFPKDSSEKEDDQMQRRVKMYNNILNMSNIPPRYRKADLWHNCDLYQDMPEKSPAFDLGLELAQTGQIVDEHSNKHALFLCGFYGVGKTWLATAVLKGFVWSRAEVFGKSNHPIWVKFHSMIREVQACYNPGSKSDTHSVIKKYQKAPFLVIDDVGDMEGMGESEDRRKILYEVVDYRNDYLLPTALTSNLDPDMMKDHFGSRSMERIIELCAFEQMGGENLRFAKSA